MIFTLTDGHEAVYLAIILQAANENKSIKATLAPLIPEEKIPAILEQIQSFAGAKCNHPILKLALEQADELLSSYEERRTHYQKKVKND